MNPVLVRTHGGPAKPEPPAAPQALPAPAYLSTEEAAAYLNITTKHLIAMRAKGLLKATRLGPHCVRYRIADLDALMARFRI